MSGSAPKSISQEDFLIFEVDSVDDVSVDVLEEEEEIIEGEMEEIDIFGRLAVFMASCTFVVVNVVIEDVLESFLPLMSDEGT
jgi:hypothetical protein